MAEQQKLFKGELMEELLRNYFLSLGYYVARSVKFKFDTNDLTDIDLFLYGRSSSLTRLRINVDIKHKTKPQAFERIVWANGLMKILKFDSCVVATTDNRPVIHLFGQLNNTTILDGKFLQRLHYNPNEERLTEEDLLNDFAKNKSYKTYGNKEWKYVYELSKAKLLTELDFSGFNSSISNFRYFVEKTLTDEQKRGTALRLTYLILSHLLIIIDFIAKDIVYLEQNEREKKLSDGFKYGNLGKEGVDKIISMAVQIAGNKSAITVMRSLNNVPTDILKEFFSKNENTKNIFNWAREFETLGFKKVLINPVDIDSPLKGVLSVLLDFFGIDRKRYFETVLSKTPA